MFNPDLPGRPVYMPSLETAARSLKVAPIIAAVHSDAEIETAIIALGREPGGGLVVIPDGFLIAHRAAIISAAARNNVPAVYAYSDFVRDGGLLSYGHDQADSFRRAATYVDRILRGDSPGAVPDQVRDGRKPQDRHGARSCHTPIDNAARNRGHRIKRRAPSYGPERRVADSLDEAKAAFRAARRTGLQNAGFRAWLESNIPGKLRRTAPLPLRF
jgi:hypothetical protein